MIFYTSIGTFPEPPIFSIFDGIEKVLADDICLIGDFLSTMFLSDDVFQFRVIPIFHSVFLLFVYVTNIGVYVLFGGLPFDGKIVREFALVPPFAFPLFEVYTSAVLETRRSNPLQYSLWISSKGYFLLRLDWFE